MATVPTPVELVQALHARAVREHLPPPAALVGRWLDADAVIAPSIDVRPGVAPPDLPDRFWLGAISYAPPGQTPDVVGGLCSGLLVLRDDAWAWESVDGSACPPWVLQTLSDLSPLPRRSGSWSATWSPPDKRPHVDAVARCLDAIADGEVYQACVCTRFTGVLDGDPLAFFCDVAASSRPAKAAWLSGAWGSIASFSPEQFLDRRDGEVSSSPIKGTVPAHVDPSVLSVSAKDTAENVMIVDLVRNDLGRVARTGSVRVPDLLSVVPAPGLWHLVSTVRATLAPAIGNDALLAATWPPASVTGTPKIRAAELLADWEEHERGVYCGGIGVAGPDGLLDLSVAIRTVAVGPDGALTLGVGGGITADSDPDAEWQECLDKAASIVDALPVTPH
ncbi:aminodeoxychorismate synthase component I [Gordonia sp. HY285]|uniref:aminodeoxychorismate synthase component I n=1 Tax=Gordonia liuliyuniae TaxID=2911517 RepID=UPI001F0004CE|nr:aminodeoxychorismate synthase component I [Gordonia liuliyuniae]MCF8612172.1 aminodeoxychorismate synthase component I [Gordonia liuliyuniae]